MRKKFPIREHSFGNTVLKGRSLKPRRHAQTKTGASAAKGGWRGVPQLRRVLLLNLASGQCENAVNVPSVPGFSATE